ncbi:MAG TPA: GNAT family N-acetyltransferase [Thermodesulfobacteriota bacterium]|nr:GNAT family N-acetyltransferase [Thermodesulfobacteriota bacterium]
MAEDQFWHVRDGDEKDLEGILSLRKTVFGGQEEDKLEEKFWNWEFTEGPDGKAFIYIVEGGGRVIGHFADIPRRFSIDGEVVLGTLSLDLMVHPDYWRKGIFAAMGRYGALRVRQGYGLFMTAFPIRLETMLGLRKIGWKDVVKLPVLVYPVRFHGILNRYFHFPPLSLLAGGVARFFYFLVFGWKKKKEMDGIEIEKVDGFDEQFDDFWQKASSLYPIMGVRNRNYLTWRYLQHPTRHYTIYRARKRGEIRGYIILRKVDLLHFNSTVIVDLLVLNKETLKALVAKGIEHSYKEGAALLGFMLPKTHPYHRDLRRWGFLPSMKTFQFMVYPTVEEKRLLNPKAWYVNWGDTDVI